MFFRFLGMSLAAALVAGCQSGAPAASAVTGPQATMAASSSSNGTVTSMAGERPWKARLVWTVSGIQWAGPPGQATSTFGGRCSVPSDYVISASFAGEATHAGRVTGTTSHCSQIAWGPQGPMGATYGDGRGEVRSANGSTITLTYGSGTTGYDAATGETWFRDAWVFSGGTGLFAGINGSGEEGGRFTDFSALLAGAPVAMWMEGAVLYKPSGE